MGVVDLAESGSCPGGMQGCGPMGCRLAHKSLVEFTIGSLVKDSSPPCRLIISSVKKPQILTPNRRRGSRRLVSL